MDNQDQYSRPRRGRPPGANRTPLSRAERRARNAGYERERRELIGEGITRLEPFVGATPDTPRVEVLAKAVCFITSARDNIESLRRQNEKLKEKIAKLHQKQEDFKLFKAVAKSSREVAQLLTAVPQPSPEEQFQAYSLETSSSSLLGFSGDGTANDRALAEELFPDLVELRVYNDEEPPPA